MHEGEAREARSHRPRRHEDEGERLEAQSDELRADAEAGVGALAEGEQILRAAEAADAEEDRRYGKDKRGDELPEDLRHAESRLARIRAAKAELEAEARAQAAAAESDDDDSPPPSNGSSPLPKHQVPRESDGTPKPKAQRNFTDPESRIQKTGEGFVQGYNCQAAVDAEHRIIVAEAVTNQPPDVEHFVPMLERVVENCGRAPKRTSADSGYYSEKNVAAAEAMGIDPYLATGRQKRGEPPPAPPRSRLPSDLTPKQKMARKLLPAPAEPSARAAR